MRYNQDELKRRLQLYFIMGSNNCKKDPSIVLEEAISGGITFFQFREKGIGAKIRKEKEQLAKQLLVICRQHDIPFIVNDDLDLALEINADGIHIGQEDENPLVVREKMAGKIVGISAHNVEEAQKALAIGADYLGVGPMYETKTKNDIRNVRGPSVITEIREQKITIPIVGIGGIKHENVRNVIHAGADGVAIISAISQSEAPQLTANKLLNEIQNIKGT